MRGPDRMSHNHIVIRDSLQLSAIAIDHEYGVQPAESAAVGLKRQFLAVDGPTRCRPLLECLFKSAQDLGGIAE